jgi:methionyl-tRNA formyltransferase
MRLIFMGTPEAAVPTIRRCLEDGHEVVSVWTQPDRPSGRGNQLREPPVKLLAQERGLTVHQPVKIKTSESFELFNSYKADAAIVVAYGRILPSTFLRAPRRGCINVHFSLLPRYRGAAPVNWAIVNGEVETGVTTMQIEEGLDTGPILLQRSTTIGEQETATELMERLALTGAELLSETLSSLHEIKPKPQDNEKATLAPMLSREDGLIDWNLDAFQIERRVRGFQPWPNAFTTYREGRLIVSRARAERIEENTGPAGSIITAHGDDLAVACGENTVLKITEVKPEARRRMSVRDYLNGTDIHPGEKFG